MPIPYRIPRAFSLIMVCVLVGGCQQYSKEQQREIDEIKRRVLNSPGLIDQDEGHGTPLETATLNGYLDLAEWLVDHHANVNALDHEEGTVLHRAVIDDQSPNLKMLRFLLGKGAHVDARRKGIETPLHLAVFLGR